MPIYEYRCPKCGDFDVMQKITEKPLKRCPTCKGKVNKLLSNPAFHLKGGGWYITDYARKGAGGGKGSEGSEKTAESSGTDASGGGASPAGDKSPGGDKKSEKSEKKPGKKTDPSASAAA